MNSHKYLMMVYHRRITTWGNSLEVYKVNLLKFMMESQKAIFQYLIYKHCLIYKSSVIVCWLTKLFDDTQELKTVAPLLDILKRFLKAERRGNWKLYLKALHEILSYLAASGHNL